MANGSPSLPKPLATVGMKPAFAWVIDLYPEDWNVVIAVGFQADLVQSAIQAYYWQSKRLHRMAFTRTDSYSDPSKGLTHTLLDSEDELAGRTFVFHAVDTLIARSPDWPDALADEDQVLLSQPSQTGTYRTISVGDGGSPQWERREVGLDDGTLAYTGVAHVVSVERFWERLHREASESPEGGETVGLDPTACSPVILTRGEWLDVGTPTGMRLAQTTTVGLPNILPKSDEALWYSGDSVIKFHLDPGFIAGRVARAKELGDAVPNIVMAQEHAFAYRFVEGETVSALLEKESVSAEPIFEELKEFWFARPTEPVMADSHAAYDAFYRVKTLSRMDSLADLEPQVIAAVNIQGVNVPTWDQQTSQIPWGTISQPLWGRVHGDLHPENMVQSPDGTLTLVDWRQDLAGSLSAFGDVYYDLGKLAHGLRVDHGTVHRGGYEVQVESGRGTFHITSVPTKVAWYEALRRFVVQQGWSWTRVQLVEALIYLNIAALHEPSEYRQLLGLQGRWMLEVGQYGECEVPGPGP